MFMFILSFMFCLRKYDENVSHDSLSHVMHAFDSPHNSMCNKTYAHIHIYNKTNEITINTQDSYISTEALLLGLCAKDTLFTINALNSQSVSLDDIKTAVQSMREKAPGSGGGPEGSAARVTSRSAEGLYDALEKYGIDFTKNAEDGKLDPVIGRDDEIRRAIQILSRRTKNNPVLIGDPGVGKCYI